MHREDLLMLAARMVPHRVRYWCMVLEGVDAIRDNEIVPDVTFVDVLSRVGANTRKW